MAAIAVLAFILLFPQTLFSQTTAAYSENFDSYAAGTRLTAAQTGGSSYYVSGPPSGGGDNARISGPWETANTTLGAQNPTPFLMFWTEVNGPAIPTTTAGQTFFLEIFRWKRAPPIA